MSAGVAAEDAVGATARWTAAVRARERERADALVDDPWAAVLAGADGLAWVDERTPASVLPIVVRTRFFDDWLRALPSDVPAQVVLLAAGLDTRAWRLAWPAGTTVFELDRAPVLEAKANALERAGAAPTCDRIAVAVDLTGAWPDALVASGFDPTRPAVWLAEGVLFYLPNDAIRRILVAVTSLSAPGSRLGFDIPDSAVLTSPWTKAWIDMQTAAGAPWIGTMDDPPAELEPLGWSVTLSQPGEGESGHGRWTLPSVPAVAPGLPHSWYVLAERPLPAAP